MFALSAQAMGYRVHVFSAERNSPASQVAQYNTFADFEDIEAVKTFALAVDAVTFEFENIPTTSLNVAADNTRVRPDANVLYIAQHRLREKRFLQAMGIPVVPFRSVTSRAELRHSVVELGFPAVLKTATCGYDGKGQTLIDSSAALENAVQTYSGEECVLESFVEYERELSVVAARGADGAVVDYGAIDNAHHCGILDTSRSPSTVAPKLASLAIALTRAILEQLEVVGVMCVEFFLLNDGTLLVNEIAPRPHNSGHLSIEASVTSQFEQQVRALCGFRLGSTSQLCPAAMANLLGHLWADHKPDWTALFDFPTVKLHLYGKEDAKPGRKMGHLTALYHDSSKTLDIAHRARRALKLS